MPLNKNGSCTICANYHGIPLLSIPGKVFVKAILNRLKPRAELLLRESECGFWQGHGYANQLFSSQMLLEKAREYHHLTYISFIDLRKVYDLVHHHSLWHILQHSYQIPEKLLTIIPKLCTRTPLHYRKTSEKFRVTCGVCQGCVLAPTLFNLYFDVAICMASDEHQLEEKGVKEACPHNASLVGNRGILKPEILVIYVEYADDMALLADNWSYLTTTLDTLFTSQKKLGLTISCKKTNSLAVLLPESPDVQCPAPTHLV